MPAFEATAPAPGTRLLGPLMLAEAAALEAQKTPGPRSPGPPLPLAGVGAECPSQPLYLPCPSSSPQVTSGWGEEEVLELGLCTGSRLGACDPRGKKIEPHAQCPCCPPQTMEAGVPS